jgi:hypothetical protein
MVSNDEHLNPYNQELQALFHPRHGFRLKREPTLAYDGIVTFARLFIPPAG